MSSEKYDAIVIGGGPGGYVAAIRLAQHGKKTALIERDLVGGECLNYGCIPSKILIENVKQFYKLSKSGLLKNAGFEWSILQDKRRKLVGRIREGVEYLLKGYNVKVYHGTALMEDDKSVRVKERNGSSREIHGENLIIASGASPISLPQIAYDGKRIIGAKEALELPEVPSTLLIVGGGAIGLELGTVYAKMGTGITIVEIMDQLLPGLEKDIAKILERKLKQLGVSIHLSSRVVSAEVKDDKVKAVIETPNETIENISDFALIAVGKRPLARELGVDNIGIELDNKGSIKIDEHCRTSLGNVYAVGDVTGPPFMAHKASRQGIIAAENICGFVRVYDPFTVPSAIFTDPEIATVGLTKDEAEKKGYKVKVTRFPYSSLGRAIAEEETEGFIRIVSDEVSGKILGVQIVGSRATEIIGEAVLAVKNKLTIEQMADAIHPHPTFTELFGEAAEAAIFKPIHMLVK
ncbi:MAG: dihydrolipoyl dehydrogenase [Nitrososphaerota archaeon]